MTQPGGIVELSSELLAQAVAWRHELHRHPELAYNEHRTSEFVAAQLAEFGLRVHRGLGGTGVVGTLQRGSSRRSIGIRADMDALPIQEQGLAQYASGVPGIMHACGHDGHVAIALAAAAACSRMPHLDGTVHFIFQPAEENEGGARRMIKEGLFELFPCESVYALHNWPTLPVGSCVARDGAMMAALATFEVTIVGQGCHGAMPHEGADCILAGGQLVTALQSIVSRNVSAARSAVLSVTQLQAGSTWNVLPDECVIRGTTRWFEDDVGALLERRLTQLAEGIAGGLGCRASVCYERRFPATVNNQHVAASVRSLIRSLPLGLDVREAQPSMSSEDFAFMLQATPGCYLWLGGGRGPAEHGLHSSRYDFNDQLLPLGAALWAGLVCRTLSGS